MDALSLLVPEVALAFEPGVRAMERCDQMGAFPFSQSRDHLARPYLTAAHRTSVDRMSVWMREAGMTVRLDSAANLIGRYEGREAGAPALIIGSHIDTVNNGGRYDGALGVMLGIDCVEAFAKSGRRLPFAVEVIAFGDEEGSRFPTPMVCSRAVVGGVGSAALEMRDAEGVSLSEALVAFGAEGETLDGARRKPADVLAFLEAHIEQGPVLEAQDLPVGVVTAIAAQKRLLVRFTGTAGHAGTSPMNLRRDPGPGAAEAILALERVCRAGSGGMVGTVGRMTARPGAFNVIPGSVEIGMDIRAESATIRDEAVAAVTREVAEIAERRGLSVAIDVVQDLSESPCDPTLSDRLAEAVAAVGVPVRRLVSGAGHDAMVMAALCPTAMLFIRCRGGVSHNPEEAVRAGDCAVAAGAMLTFIDSLQSIEPRG